MWRQLDYTFKGDHFAIDKPHNILPSRGGGATRRSGSLAATRRPTRRRDGWESAPSGQLSPIHAMKPMVDSYKKGISECREPLGDYVNDNVMLTNSVICFEDRDRAREAATRWNRGYVLSLVCLYHDTFPKPPGAPVWPEQPAQMDLAGVDAAIKAGALPLRKSGGGRRADRRPTRRPGSTRSSSASRNHLSKYEATGVPR